MKWIRTIEEYPLDAEEDLVVRNIFGKYEIATYRRMGGKGVWLIGSSIVDDEMIYAWMRIPLVDAIPLEKVVDLMIEDGSSYSKEFDTHSGAVQRMLNVLRDCGIIYLDQLNNIDLINLIKTPNVGIAIIRLLILIMKRYKIKSYQESIIENIDEHPITLNKFIDILFLYPEKILATELARKELEDTGKAKIMATLRKLGMSSLKDLKSLTIRQLNRMIKHDYPGNRVIKSVAEYLNRKN
jgi:hypothetical protein